MKSRAERVLIVGAGAVGQVYGYHLQRGGAEVTFLVKPTHLAGLRQPLPLYPLNSGVGHPRPVFFENFNLCSDMTAIEPGTFDQFWLCVSSTALRTGWLPVFAERLGEGTLVSLVPGLEDRALLLEYVPAAQLITGLINLIGYQTPLPCESTDPPGVAFWFPPFGATPLSGPVGRRDAVISSLRAGGQPARAHPDVGAISGFPTAVLMPFLLGLEASQWSFNRLLGGQIAHLSVSGVKEALAIVAAYQERAVPFWGALVCPSSVRALLVLAPKVLPMPLEAYLAYHFTKLGDQTRFFVERYIRLGQDFSLPTDALLALRALVRHDA